jgi:Methyltransferase domain
MVHVQYHSKRSKMKLVLVSFVAPCWWSCSNAFLLKEKNNEQNPRFVKNSDYFSAHQQQQFALSSSSSRKDFISKTAAAVAGGSVAFAALALPPSLLAVLLLQCPKEAAATMQDPKTGTLLPSEGEIEDAVPRDWTTVDNPFTDTDPKQSSSSNLFNRLDSSPDSVFYANPRFVEHIDENAVQLLTDYVSNQAITDGCESVLDLCSSWTSHITASRVKKDLKRIVGVGMNQQELEGNPILTEWLIQDLNQWPKLDAFADASFDIVLCQLSIDYLTRPLQVLREAHRVLRPGGTIHILFSNRLFLTKAVALWTGADDIDHAYTVACYLHFCCAAADATQDDSSSSSAVAGGGGCFENIQAIDLSTRRPQRGSSSERRIIGDPLYVVKGTKKKIAA